MLIIEHVSRHSAIHGMLDTDGVPCLVECKQTGRQRILEKATTAYLFWPELVRAALLWQGAAWSSSTKIVMMETSPITGIYN